MYSRVDTAVECPATPGSGLWTLPLAPGGPAPVGAPRSPRRRVAQHGGDQPSVCAPPASGAPRASWCRRRRGSRQGGSKRPHVSPVASRLRPGWIPQSSGAASTPLPHPPSHSHRAPRWTAAGSPQVRGHPTGRHHGWVAGEASDRPVLAACGLSIDVPAARSPGRQDHGYRQTNPVANEPTRTARARGVRAPRPAGVGVSPGPASPRREPPRRPLRANQSPLPPDPQKPTSGRLGTLLTC